MHSVETSMTRQIIHIDPTLCNGCGQCVSHCTFHAIEIVDGLARLRGDEYCDGIALCEPTCPQGAISLGAKTNKPFEPHAASADLSSTAFRHRLSICCSATQCGRLCSRLIKQPGKAGVFCVDIQTNEITDLYAALNSSIFHCPEEKF
jgi:ferredoxin